LKSATKVPAKTAAESPLTEALKARLVELRASGFNRLYQRGQIFEFSTPESLLDLDFTLPVFVLLDRIVVSAENRSRIVDAAEIAYREAAKSPLKNFRARRMLPVRAIAFPDCTNARAAIALAANRSRACSASTIPLEPALAARASATRWTSI